MAGMIREWIGCRREGVSDFVTSLRNISALSHWTGGMFPCDAQKQLPVRRVMGILYCDSPDVNSSSVEKRTAYTAQLPSTA